MILNFNIREYLDKKFISPDDFILTESPISGFDFYLDLNQFPDFIAFANQKDLTESTYFDFVNDVLFNNDGDNWGSCYPRYEVVVNDGGCHLIPFDFVSTEKSKLLRRHRIERLIKHNVRLETELKGLRKAVKKIIDVLDLSESPEVANFLKNDSYISKIIIGNPKDPKE